MNGTVDLKLFLVAFHMLAIFYCCGKHIPQTVETPKEQKSEVDSNNSYETLDKQNTCNRLVYKNTDFFTQMPSERLSAYERQEIIPCAVYLAVHGDSIAEGLLLTLFELRLEHNLTQQNTPVALPDPIGVLDSLFSERTLRVTYMYLSYDNQSADDGHGNCFHYGMSAFKPFLKLISPEKGKEYSGMFSQLEIEAANKGLFDDGFCVAHAYIYSKLFPLIKQDWIAGSISMRQTTPPKN